MILIVLFSNKTRKKSLDDGWVRSYPSDPDTICCVSHFAIVPVSRDQSDSFSSRDHACRLMFSRDNSKGVSKIPMNTVVKIQPKDVDGIPFQEASFDIWDKKYRLTAKDGSPIDQSMDDTYKRVARALADVETEDLREEWYESFLWALRHGAIPAGRVTSNAGALEHKPATSTINCTVSGTIRDSMDDILNKVHEAGLTLNAGCGIAYEVSTLRPPGAYLSGPGAYTCGPLSFIGIYHKMSLPLPSARGRPRPPLCPFRIP